MTTSSSESGGRWNASVFFDLTPQQPDHHQGDPVTPNAVAARCNDHVRALEACGVGSTAPAQLAATVAAMLADRDEWHLLALRRAVEEAVDFWRRRIRTDDTLPTWSAVTCAGCGEVQIIAGGMLSDTRNSRWPGLRAEHRAIHAERPWDRTGSPVSTRPWWREVSGRRDTWTTCTVAPAADEPGAYVCSGCAVTCDRCGAAHTSDAELFRVVTESEDAQLWCDTCEGTEAMTCEQCDERVPTSEFDHDRDVCHGCIRDASREADMRGISGYHDQHRRRVSHPVPSPWTQAAGGVYLGVELEVEVEERAPRGDCAVALRDAAERAGGRVWVEHDGSLERGFEMITDPIGLDAHRTLWPAVLSDPTTRHLRSHATTTCGLHVHVSRRVWRRTAVARCAMWHNAADVEPLIRAVARRYGGGYCGVKGAGDARTDGARIRRGWSALWAQSGTRYELVNLTNSTTVEFRLFRGSLHVQAVLAACEWAVATLRYATATPCHVVRAHPVASFLAWLSAPEQSPDTAHLRPYLRSRLERIGRDDLAALVRVAPVKHAHALAHTLPSSTTSSTTTTTTEE